MTDQRFYPVARHHKRLPPSICRFPPSRGQNHTFLLRILLFADKHFSSRFCNRRLDGRPPSGGWRFDTFFWRFTMSTPTIPAILTDANWQKEKGVVAKLVKRETGIGELMKQLATAYGTVDWTKFDPYVSLDALK